MNQLSAIQGKGLVVMTASELARMVEDAAERGARKAMVELQDRRSYHAASQLMRLNEVAEYLGFTRQHISDLRNKRKLAKSAKARDDAFAPEYGSGKSLRFKQSEIDAWVESQRR